VSVCCTSYRSVFGKVRAAASSAAASSGVKARDGASLGRERLLSRLDGLPGHGPGPLVVARMIPGGVDYPPVTDPHDVTLGLVGKTLEHNVSPKDNQTMMIRM